MDGYRIEGNRKHAKGKFKGHAGRFADDDLAVYNRRVQPAGKAHARYGIAKADADREIADWERRFNSRFSE